MTKIVVSVRVDDEVWEVAKKYSFDNKLSLGDLIETSILHAVQEK
jgi:hypothetical protein